MNQGLNSLLLPWDKVPYGKLAALAYSPTSVKGKKNKTSVIKHKYSEPALLFFSIISLLKLLSQSLNIEWNREKRK